MYTIAETLPSAMASPAYEMEEIQVVELHMMDKTKYFPLAALSGFTIRTILYPFGLIKTRLQVQRQNAIYKGTFDAFTKIVKYEGFSGLYKGFWISNLLVGTSMSYIVTYEHVRNYLRKHAPESNNQLRSFIAGGCASAVGQTSMVPIDIVSQHLQMIGQKDAVSGKTLRVKSLDHLEIPASAYRTRIGVLKAIVSGVYKKDGLRGFYKGYVVSLAVYAPNSAMWWFFYDTYSSKFILLISLVRFCMSELHLFFKSTKCSLLPSLFQMIEC